MTLYFLLTTLPTGAVLLGFPHTMTYLFDTRTTKTQWQFSVKVSFLPSHPMFPLKLSITRPQSCSLGLPKASFFYNPASLLSYGKSNSSHSLPSGWWGKSIPISSRIHFFLQITLFLYSFSVLSSFKELPPHDTIHGKYPNPHLLNSLFP